MTYIYIHANRQELDVLDHLQQFSQLVDGNPRMRMYVNGLEQKLKDPNFRNAVLEYGRQHYSKGGRVGVDPLSESELESYRSAGRMGDDCVAVVGPYTKAMLDIFARGKGTINPTTGLPEFFSLGGLFNSIGSGLSSIGSGIWNGVKSVGGDLLHAGSQALPQLAQMGGQALGNRFGGPIGGQIGGMLGGMAGNAAAPVVNQFGQQLNPQSGSSYQGANPFTGMAQNMQQGMNPMHAGMHAFNPYMQSQFGQGGQYGQHPLVSQAMNAYQNYAQRMGANGGGIQQQQPGMLPSGAPDSGAMMQQQQPMGYQQNSGYGYPSGANAYQPQQMGYGQ